LNENEKNALTSLKDAIKAIVPDMEIVLYGSKARGDDREWSDIDILVISNTVLSSETEHKISEIKFDIELRFEVCIGMQLEYRTFWDSPRGRAMPFHWNIDKEGIVL
jgi:predicted nucleotidyltransferase